MWSAWTGVWLFWNALGLATAWYLPGASYLFLLPGAIAVSTALLAAALPKRIGPRGLLAACCLGPIAAGGLWLPMQVLLYDGIGFMVFPVYPLCAGLVTMTALPLLSGRATSPQTLGTEAWSDQ